MGNPMDSYRKQQKKKEIMKNKKVREKQRKEAEYLKNPDKLLNEVRKLESTAGGKKKAQQQVRENVLKLKEKHQELLEKKKVIDSITEKREKAKQEERLKWLRAHGLAPPGNNEEEEDQGPAGSTNNQQPPPPPPGGPPAMAGGAVPPMPGYAGAMGYGRSPLVMNAHGAFVPAAGAMVPPPPPPAAGQLPHQVNPYAAQMMQGMPQPGMVMPPQGLPPHLASQYGAAAMGMPGMRPPPPPTSQPPQPQGTASSADTGKEEEKEEEEAKPAPVKKFNPASDPGLLSMLPPALRRKQAAKQSTGSQPNKRQKVEAVAKASAAPGTSSAAAAPRGMSSVPKPAGARLFTAVPAPSGVKLLTPKQQEKEESDPFNDFLNDINKLG